MRATRIDSGRRFVLSSVVCGSGAGALGRAVLIFAAVLALGLATTSASADGGAIYAKECARCHGADGSGDTAVGKAMKATPLAGQTKDQVVEFVRGSAKHKAPSGKLSDEELAAVATKVAGF